MGRGRRKPPVFFAMRTLIVTLLYLTMLSAVGLAYLGMLDAVCMDGVHYDNWGLLDYALQAAPTLLGFALGIAYCHTDNPN
jgi:hypothetical protein